MKVNLFITILELKWTLFVHVCTNDLITVVEMA